MENGYPRSQGVGSITTDLLARRGGGIHLSVCRTARHHFLCGRPPEFKADGTARAPPAGAPPPLFLGGGCPFYSSSGGGEPASSRLRNWCTRRADHPHIDSVVVEHLNNSGTRVAPPAGTPLRQPATQQQSYTGGAAAASDGRDQACRAAAPPRGRRGRGGERGSADAPTSAPLRVSILPHRKRGYVTRPIGSQPLLPMPPGHACVSTLGDTEGPLLSAPPPAPSGHLPHYCCLPPPREGDERGAGADRRSGEGVGRGVPRSQPARRVREERKGGMGSQSARTTLAASHPVRGGPAGYSTVAVERCRVAFVGSGVARGPRLSLLAAASTGTTGGKEGGGGP